MTKMTEYLNKKYQNVTFTGVEMSVIYNFQDAYEAIDNATGQQVWLVCDEDNSIFMSDKELKAHKDNITKIIFASYGLK